MIAIEGSLQTTSYQDKNGNNRTKVEVVASNVSFCGSKAAERAVVKDFDQQKPQSVPEYSQGSADDFSVIDDSEDLPF